MFLLISSFQNDSAINSYITQWPAALSLQVDPVLKFFSEQLIQWHSGSWTALRTLLLRIVNPRIMGTALHFALSDSKSNNIKKTVCFLNGEKIVRGVVWSLCPALWIVWTYASYELPYWNTVCCRKQILEALLALSGALRMFSFQEFVTSH